jgi:(1->4)-alpha-D-glucan 1-alpha-D-glucosylmutase
MADQRVVPTATYRLQLRRGFGFADAADVVPYLAQLGVSHVYCSPVLQAVPGSAHGYDVVDHTRLSDDLGGEPAWREFVDACRRNGLGVVVDIVPNHMAVPTPERLNKPLWDVLANGDRSSYADWFDIDWAAGEGKLLMPVLGRPIAECLRDGEITVDSDASVIRYYDHELPLAGGADSGGDGKLEAQHYRLAFWRVANEELNYRRFFDVTSLIGVRVENPVVFDETHALLLRLVRDGDIDGLRIDHPDGLADPGGYLRRLHDASGGVWTVVEKILEGDEVLPADWRCDGTTGYDAIAAVTAVLVDAAGEQPLTDAYHRFTGRPGDFAVFVEDGKRLAVERMFPAEVDRLLRDLEPARRADLDAADLTHRGLRTAIEELLVHFDVYRAYADVPAGRAQVEAAVRRAVERRPDRAGELAWLRRVLLREVGGSHADGFVTRFEQTTGPVTAKGVEDTAFYRYHRLVALNEVGGDPGRFGRSVEDWHAFCARVADDWPATMTTLSTHDTKRSEDVRARLLVLAEMPTEWERAVARWRARVGGVDADTEYLMWQTIVGTLSAEGGLIEQSRLTSYLEKANREAKQRTSWTDVNEPFEAAVRDLIASVYADAELMRDVGEWAHTHVLDAGRSNSLAQKLMQLTMPGVPDVYQGQELPDYSLVDPDNRRPVDYDARRRAATAGAGADPKFRVTAAALRVRRERRDSFASGYTPLAVEGASGAHAIAYLRGADVATVVTRLPAGLAAKGGWGETRVSLPPGTWRDAITGRKVSGGVLAEVLADLPVALLVHEGVAS